MAWPRTAAEFLSLSPNQTKVGSASICPRSIRHLNSIQPRKAGREHMYIIFLDPPSTLKKTLNTLNLGPHTPI